MRIKWNAENAQEVQKAVAEIRTCLETCAGASDRIRAAFAEANPERSSKRLKTLEDSYEVSLRKLRELMEETGVADADLVREIIEGTGV